MHVADTRGERVRSYLGRSYGHDNLMYFIVMVETRCRMIRRYNIPEWKVHELGNCRKGPWRAALMLNQILSDKEIASQGYMPMTSYYLQICEN